MTDQTDIEDDHQRSVVVPVASARRDVEHRLAERVVPAGFARAAWPESVQVADLRLPLATVEPEQHGNRAPESGGVRQVTVTGLRVPDPQFPTTTTCTTCSLSATPHPPADTGPRRRRLDWPRRVSGRHASEVSA